METEIMHFNEFRIKFHLSFNRVLFALFDECSTTLLPMLSRKSWEFENHMRICTWKKFHAEWRKLICSIKDVREYLFLKGTSLLAKHKLSVSTLEDENNFENKLANICRKLAKLAKRRNRMKLLHWLFRRGSIESRLSRCCP